MSDHDNRNERAENGDGERVVVRDRRRIDPVTGEVRAPAEQQAGGADDVVDAEIVDEEKDKK